jgi:hypothetical protein
MPLFGDSRLGRAWDWVEIALYAAAPVLLIGWLFPGIPRWLILVVYAVTVLSLLVFVFLRWRSKRRDDGQERA